MEGGRGSTWANFEESAQKNDSLMGWPSSRNPLSPTAGRLCREDMAIYGEEPASDSLSLVVCVECGRVVKSQALVNHKEQYHTSKLNVPVPHPLLPPYAPPLRTPHTIGIPSSAMSTNNPSSHGPNMRGEMVTGFIASDLPTTALSGRGPKEFDVNRHCGVWIEDEQRQCTHSLNCKFHSLEERQNVRGRSKPLETLLEERKQKKKKNKLKKSDSVLSSSQQLPFQSPSGFELVSPPSAPSSLGPPSFIEGGGASWITSPVEVRRLPSVTMEEHVQVDMDSFPRPLAVCSFGSRSTVKGGGLLLGRRTDNLRSALATLSGRSKDYSHTTLHRKHSYNSLSRRRTSRKYYNHRHHHQHETLLVSQPPFKLPVPLQPNPPPHTPSHPLSSPLTANTVLTNIDSLSSSMPGISSVTSRLSPTLTSGEEESGHPLGPSSQFHNTLPARPHLPSSDPTSEDGFIGDTVAGSGYLNEVPDIHSQTSASTPVQSMETDLLDKVSTSKSSGKKSKSRRTKRRKHKQSKSSNQMASNDEPAVFNSTGNGLTNDTNSRLEETSTTENHYGWNNRDGHGTPHIPMNGTIGDSHYPPNEGRGFEPAQRRSIENPLPAPQSRGGEAVQKSVGTVRIKEEPVSDHEDEIHNQPQHNNTTSKSPSIGLNGLVTPNTSPPVHHSFNSVNSPQSFVINPSRHLSGNHPLMTTLSPQLRAMMPLSGMTQNPSMFQTQQHQRFQLAANAASPSQPGGTPPLHLPGSSLQLLPDHLQRHVMQQNTALLLASNPALLQQHQERTHQMLQQQTLQNSPVNSLSPGGFLNLAAGVNRTGTQKSPTLGAIHPGMPQLHQVGGGGNLAGKTGHLPTPILSNFQISGSQNRTSQASTKVRAPISHIPSTAQGHPRNIPHLTSLGQAQSIPALNQSPFHHGKQATPPSSAAQRFSSQQVT